MFEKNIELYWVTESSVMFPEIKNALKVIKRTQISI